MVLLNQFAQMFDSEHIAFIKKNDKHSVDIVMHNYPQEWIDHYNKSHYDRYDYARSHLHNYFTPTLWGKTEFNKSCSKGQKLYDEASQYKLKSGLSISFQNSNNAVTGVSLASSRSEVLFKKFLKKEKNRLLPILFLINTYFNLVHEGSDHDDQSLQQIGELIKDHHRQYLKCQRDLVKSLRLFKAATVEIDMMVPASVRQHTLPLCRLAQQQFEKYVSAAV